MSIVGVNPITATATKKTILKINFLNKLIYLLSGAGELEQLKSSYKLF